MKLDIDRLRELAKEATPSPWGYDGYSKIWSDNNGYDEWQDPLLDADHSLEAYGECVGGGSWTWTSTNPVTGEVTVIGGRGYKHSLEDKQRNPLVAHVPSSFGDTAVGKNAANAKYIAAVEPEVVLELLRRLEHYRDVLRILSSHSTMPYGKAAYAALVAFEDE